MELTSAAILDVNMRSFGSTASSSSSKAVIESISMLVRPLPMVSPTCLMVPLTADMAEE